MLERKLTSVLLHERYPFVVLHRSSGHLALSLLHFFTVLLGEARMSRRIVLSKQLKRRVDATHRHRKWDP